MAFNAAIPSTYPDRFSIRVGGPQIFTERSHYLAFFGQDKWRLSGHVTVSLGLRYDLEVLPIPETDDPLVTTYPTDRNNLAPRLGATYTLDKQGVVRAGYGRFFDKTHFEVVGGLYTGTPFTNSFNSTFPVAGPDLGPRNGQFPTDPFLVNGPVINHALLDQMFPPGSAIRNTSATWDNPDRRTPYSDEYSVGYEREIVSDLAASVDYIRSQNKDLLMALNLNPQVRSNPNVSASTLTRVPSATLDAAYAELNKKYPGFAPFSGAVTQFVNTGRVDYDAVMFQIRKRYSHNYSAQVWYTYSSSRGNTSGNGSAGSNFQVLNDLHLEINKGHSDFDIRHNFTFSGTVLVPKTYGLNLSWVLRALSGRPFTLTNGNVDPDLNGIQAEPLAAGQYSGSPANNATTYSVNNYSRRAQRRLRAGLHVTRHALRLPDPAPAASSSRAVGGCLQPDQPRGLRESVGQPGVGGVPDSEHVQHELRAAQSADRGAIRVLEHWYDRVRPVRRVRGTCILGQLSGLEVRKS